MICIGRPEVSIVLLYFSVISCFEELFDLKEEKIGLVVTFLAILELMKELLIEIVQAKEFGTIHVKTLVEKQ